MTKQVKHRRKYPKRKNGRRRPGTYKAGSRAPKRIHPMLGKKLSGKWILDSPDWAGEYKFDGTRCLALRLEDGSVHMRNRMWADYTRKLPKIVEDLKTLKDFPWVLDGELVYFNPKTGDDFFTPCQRRCATNNPEKRIILSKEDIEVYGVEGKRGQTLPILNAYPLVYMIFDLLKLKGNCVKNRTYLERKQLLKTFLKGEMLPHVEYVDYWEENKRERFEKLCEENAEGMMLKSETSTYVEGRSSFWQKAKCQRTDEAVIVGITVGTGERRSTFGALVLGQYENGKLRYVGKASGFTANQQLELYKKAMSLPETECPFEYAECRKVERKREGVKRWVKPQLVAEIRYLEKSVNGVFRFPVFLRLRQDKAPRDCKFSKI